MAARLRYTAAALTAATRPVTLSIGRVASRPVFARLTRWWVRRFRTWHAHPLSVPQMLALQAARGDLLTYFAALAVVLRAVLPWRWWYRVTGDPVVAIMRIGLPRAAGGFDDPELQGRILQALLTVPGSDRDMTRADEDDPLAAIRAQQRAAMHGTATRGGPELSLAHMAAAVRQAYGESWYYNPDRWPTSDGYAPFAVCVLEHVGLEASYARASLIAFEGHALVKARDPRAALAKLQRQAVPLLEH